MTDPLTPDLTALVGSRLCHDLISPLGAIANGLELLEMSGVGAGPEMQLVTESVTGANAKLKFFRVAFGQASAEQRVGRPEIAAVIAEYTAGGRMTLDWLAEGDQARRSVKLAFLALLCLETAMPWGGAIAVRAEADTWTLTAEATRLRDLAPLWALLNGGPLPEDGLAPAQVQFALLPREAAQQGRRVAAEVTETTIRITF
ncbi:histidine phosphotransferase family protein [Phaeovulum vinaykumarii]|uniref:Histidine phosphotransferase ChpT n=1 Tax=Phaeovulum vinaykumarii TaxID=407234 RepID=A0A1N7MEQ5_9RHOB|nr:histidine phosphotransferase family protein [Phaeovulum vinaykumarii]SIS84461.1 histidine phosphotransferase ChpT [Phaeovulum vinaykumarii]SOC11781.1 histidine phosphotransferase ChpT [Phaeovulum vinaykumarii]